MIKFITSPFIKGFIFCSAITATLFDGNSFAQNEMQAVANDSLQPLHAVIPSGKLPQMVPVLYGEQLRERLAQSVSFLNGHKLESAPVSLLSNAFAGQLSGLYSQQASDAPRYNNTTLNLRGRSPLIVIDGVPRYNLVNLDNGQTLYDVLSINPEQVASVTLLKDALSTAMLGNRGMDGVLMITTRNRGEERSPTFSITAQTGFQEPVKMRETLSSFEYAKLYNEALVNVGGAAVYSQAALDA